MATHPNKVVAVQATWRRGWALMWAGRTTEGYELLSCLKVSDLEWIADGDRQERLVVRVQSIIDRNSPFEAGGDRTLTEVLIAAARKGDKEARDLLIFGDLEETASTKGTALDKNGP